VDKGNTYYKRAQYDLAGRNAEQMQKDPANTTVSHNLVIALYRQKKYDRTGNANRLQQNPAGSRFFLPGRRAYPANPGGKYQILQSRLCLGPDDQQAQESHCRSLIGLKKTAGATRKKQKQSSNEQQQKPSETKRLQDEKKH